MKKYSQIGIIGLGTMGSALARNIESRGFRVSVYNRGQEKLDLFKQNYKGEFQYYKQIKAFVQSIEKPRKIILMVSPDGVNDILKNLYGYLDKKDIIIDGGNSYHVDTNIRSEELAKQNIRYLGFGISGGEKGALEGPSIMAGGDISAWNEVKHIFDKVVARDFHGNSCISYFGSGGMGHLVKMVHNGIEYGLMQTIAEGYSLLREGYGLTPVMISEVYRRFNENRLESYLIEISEKIFKSVDEQTGKPMVEMILDKAGQKGTGMWTARDALLYGIESSTLAQAVQARISSSDKAGRLKLSKKYNLNQYKLSPSLALEEILPKLEQALFCNWLVVMDQGLKLIQAVSQELDNSINLKEVVRVWQGGCIIQAKVLGDIELFIEKESILESKFGLATFKEGYEGWRDVLKTSLEVRVPSYCLSSGFNTLESASSAQTSANVIQAMRDFFGAHGFQRVDENEKKFFHHNWQ